MSDGALLWLNGEFQSAAEARVSVLDRGFLYGDSVFSTMRAYSGRIAHWPEHWERLNDNLGQLGIQPEWSADETLDALIELVRRNGLTKADASVRVQVTRGVGEQLGLAASEGAQPTILAIATEVDEKTRNKRESGHSLAVCPGLHSGGTARIKISFYAKNLLCTMAARERGADDGVFVDGRGFVAEASTANLFFTRDGVLFTPSLEVGALPGITRGHVLKLSEREGIRVEHGLYTPEQFALADEVFATSSVSEIYPIHHFDGHAIRRFRQRPLTRQIQALYDEFTAHNLYG